MRNLTEHFQVTYLGGEVSIETTFEDALETIKLYRTTQPLDSFGINRVYATCQPMPLPVEEFE